MTRPEHADEMRIGEPLRLRPVLDPKPWGGRRLERYGKQLPDGPIGESLESGNESLIEGGRFDGMTLGQLANERPGQLLGAQGMRAAGEIGGFPLLVKLIDAQQDLSIQVHPSDDLAPPGSRGKTEAWLILEADAGGNLVTGVSETIDIARIEEQLVREQVQRGDVLFVEAGTVHAIGAGVLLYEVQQASNITYRLYDWGRPRELHLERGLEAAVPDRRAHHVAPLQRAAGTDVLVACRHFLLERWIISSARTVVENRQSCRVLTVVGGAVSLGGLDLRCGDSVVLPADLPETRLAGEAVVLIASIPDLESDVIGPLRAAGHSDAAIRDLGVDRG